jgi:hypothetical protein
MPSAAARKRKLRYKEYTRVQDAENYAKNQLGVPEVNYGGNIVIANNTNHGLFTVHERGVPMPSRVEVKEFKVEDGEDPNDLAFYLAPPGNAVGELYINSSHKVWTNPAAAAQEGRQKQIFSTDDPRHFIMHEMGELATHQSIGGIRFFNLGEAYLGDEEEFQRLDRQHIRNVVSRQAARDHTEFTAEVFAALVLGRDEIRQDNMVMEALRRFGGEKLIEWTAQQ